VTDDGDECNEVLKHDWRYFNELNDVLAGCEDGYGRNTSFCI
jgi:hypothetical protein